MSMLYSDSALKTCAIALLYYIFCWSPSVTEDRVVPIIKYTRENVQVEVPEGDSVRYPALENDVQVYCGIYKFANCHGNGLCGTDRVAVSPSGNTSALTFMEKFWLRKDLEKNPNMRLACQVK